MLRAIRQAASSIFVVWSSLFVHGVCENVIDEKTLTLQTGWPYICNEVASLRENLPDYILKLGELYAARQIVSVKRSRRLELLRDGPQQNLTFWGGTMSAGSSSHSEKPGTCAASTCKEENASSFLATSACDVASSGPWRLKVDIAGSRKSHDIYGRSQRVLLIFGENYPGSLPEIRFPGKIKSIYLSSSDEERSQFSQDLHTNTANKLLERRLRENTVKTDTYSLPGILSVLQDSLAGPLHKHDEKSWRHVARTFAEDANVFIRYEKYGQKHPRLYKSGGITEEEAIDPTLLSLVAQVKQAATREEGRSVLLKSGFFEEVIPGDVWAFRVFTQQFCELLMEEIHHFYGSKLPARRPNSMNNYGIILNEIGMQALVFFLQDAVIQPLSSVLLPEEGSELESHHTFTIRYRGGEDTHLDVHTDDSDVTFNVNIYENYTGAPLVFCGINGQPDHRMFRTAYMHQLGYAVLHRGRHRHGAEDILSGERMNLVIWSYSHNYRSSSASEKKHQRELKEPDYRCVSYTHDRDFGRWKAWPDGKKEKHFGRGWCPPRGKEYPGFVPDISEDELQRQRQQGGGQSRGGS